MVLRSAWGCSMVRGLNDAAQVDVPMLDRKERILRVNVADMVSSSSISWMQP